METADSSRIWMRIIPATHPVPETPKATTFHRLTQMYMYSVYMLRYILV